ncbi:hypothetical protein BDV93DRAFT_444894 [Ceratobasidium sp. AG-I]|nr:hypothetical protein BDV93DRAFT_444894 [Ceratobasidium sp. AG-I]
MRYVFLPPYSPDCNPIELAFSSIKAGIRREGNRMQALMSLAGGNEQNTVIAELFRHVFAITEDKAQSWFEHCNYL